MSFLDNVQLAFQCPLRWEKLVGGERERYCSTCEKHVHNISAMTRGEAAQFLREQKAPVCIRVEVDASGRAVHRPGLAAFALAASLAACGTDGDSGLDSGVGAVEADGIVHDEGSDSRSQRSGQHADRADGSRMIAEATEQSKVGKIKGSPDVQVVPPKVESTQILVPTMPMMGGIAPPRHELLGRPASPPPKHLMGEPAVEVMMGDYAAPEPVK